MRAGAAVTSVKCCGSDACYWAPSGKQLFVCFREVLLRDNLDENGGNRDVRGRLRAAPSTDPRADRITINTS
jgi:hypothetical protein